MGSGSYSHIVYGIRSMKDAGLDKEVVVDLAEEVLDRISTAYEAGTDHLGISLISTLGRQTSDTLSIGTCGLDQIADRIRSCCRKTLPEAQKQWKKFQEAAAKQDLKIPDAELLWIDDYD